MKQTTVREIAYQETYNWMTNDKEGDEPLPPPGLHPLALAEWEAGRDAALIGAEMEEEQYDDIIDLVVCIVKVALMYGLFSVGTYIDTWWSMLGSALVALALVRKFFPTKIER